MRKCESYLGFYTKDPPLWLMSIPSIQEIETNWYCIRYCDFPKYSRVKRFFKFGAKEYFRVVENGNERWYCRKLKSEDRDHLTHIYNLIQREIYEGDDCLYVPMPYAINSMIQNRKSKNTYVKKIPLLVFSKTNCIFTLSNGDSISHEGQAARRVNYWLLLNRLGIDTKNEVRLYNNIINYFEEAPYWLLIRGFVSEQEIAKSGWEIDETYIPKIIEKSKQINV